MKESLQKLTEEEPEGLPAQLLRAGRSVQPPPEVAAKTLGRLGLGAATLSIGAKAAAVTTSSSVSWVFVKWTGMGILLGVSSLLTIEALTSPTDVAPRTVESKPVASHVHSTPGFDPFTSHAPPTPAPLESSESQPPLPPPSPPHSALASGSTSTPALAEELALLDRVRRALLADDPSLALALLERHRRRFIQPQLAEEAAYLRSRALQASGESGAAERAAEEFRRRYPNSTLPRRWRAEEAKP